MTEIAAFTLSGLYAFFLVSGGLALGLFFVWAAAAVAQVAVAVRVFPGEVLPSSPAASRSDSAAPGAAVRAISG